MQEWILGYLIGADLFNMQIHQGNDDCRSMTYNVHVLVATKELQMLTLHIEFTLWVLGLS